MLIHLVLFLLLLLSFFFSLPSSFCVSVYVALVHKTLFFFMIVPQCIHCPTGEYLHIPKFLILKFLIMNSITHYFIKKFFLWLVGFLFIFLHCLAICQRKDFFTLLILGSSICILDTKSLLSIFSANPLTFIW